MATTTNYGWTTPDDTALVKDGAAAIRTLGSSVDTTTKNLNPSTTLGDIEYRSSTANVNTRLAIGSTGNVLTVSGGVPVWSAPAGGGKVLQVVSATTSTQVSSASVTYIDSLLTATITPTLITSKVLVLVSQNGIFKDTSNTALLVRLMRDATNLGFLSGLGGYTGNAITLGFGSISASYLDSPATTSAITYKTQIASQAGTGNAGVQVLGIGSEASMSMITLLEIGA
jgi:hypothetical protein